MTRYFVNGVEVDPHGNPVKGVVSNAEATDTGLANLTVPELKAMATERGIDGAGDMRKAELIAALEESE